MKARSLVFLLAILLLFVAGCNKSAPVIGISSGWPDGRIIVSDAYVYSVRAAGGVPVVLPPVLTEEEAREVLSHLDGLVLTGGEDVDPARYGETALNETVEVNYKRDTSDFLLASEALRRDMPILGICRGEQLLNVALGGTLYQDLPSQLNSDDAICHRQTESKELGTHIIYLEPESSLRRIMGVDSLMVNSFHHQAVKYPGTGVKVTASTADGITEAWECGNLICVQFHPEMMIKGGNNALLPIFEDLVARSR